MSFVCRASRHFIWLFRSGIWDYELGESQEQPGDGNASCAGGTAVGGCLLRIERFGGIGFGRDFSGTFVESFLHGDDGLGDEAGGEEADALGGGLFGAGELLGDFWCCEPEGEGVGCCVAGLGDGSEGVGGIADGGEDGGDVRRGRGEDVGHGRPRCKWLRKNAASIRGR